MYASGIIILRKTRQGTESRLRNNDPCSCTNKEQITNHFAKKVFIVGNKPEI